MPSSIRLQEVDIARQYNVQIPIGLNIENLTITFNRDSGSKEQIKAAAKTAIAATLYAFDQQPAGPHNFDARMKTTIELIRSFRQLQKEEISFCIHANSNRPIEFPFCVEIGNDPRFDGLWNW